MKILLIEDDQSLGELLASVLTTHRYTVDVARDGQSGLELASLWQYDLILLDLELPKLDGISICRELRQRENTTPILMLTVKNRDNDVVLGLDAGADDYMSKPCDPKQLLARIRALLRRGHGMQTTVLMWGGLSLDPALAKVTYQERSVSLGPKEYNLLELFLRNPQRIFSRAAILDNLWTADDFPTENAVTNLIKDLRRKLKAAGMQADLIETLYGLGYRLKPAPVEVPEIKGLETDRDRLHQPASNSPRFHLPQSDPLGTQSSQPNSENTEPVDADPAETNLEGADPAGTDPDNADSAYQAGLASIRLLTEQFQATLGQRLTRLVEVLRSLQENDLQPQDREMARQDAHRLAGVLGMFGYPQGTDVASDVEAVLRNLTSTPEQITHAWQSLIAFQAAIANTSAHLSLGHSLPVSLPQVLLIDDDPNLIATLQQEQFMHGKTIQVLDPATALDAEVTEPPMVILISWGENAPSEAETICTQHFRAQFPSVPVLILAAHDRLLSRVMAARFGCQRYLCKPIQSVQVWDAIAQINCCTLSQQSLEQIQATVMVVDDDPIILSTILAILQPWGIKVIGLSNPEQFWDILTQINPDLLVLDLELPTFSGIDLCRVVRQDIAYGHLPILVITAHRDAMQVQQVFEAGADDLIYKPIVGSELTTRIINRIERARLRQQLDHVQQQQTQTLQQESRLDALTQIANRRRFDEFLAREWLYHQQAQVHLSLILCDVDLFKQFNDRYGHLAGDSCLNQLAQVLQTCIRPTVDLVARYGGEEFGVILPNTDLNGALQVARRIQSAIASLNIPHEDSAVSPHVTLSIGITGTIPAAPQSLSQLLATADQALYAAKERGRNTYCLYPL